MLKSYLIYFNTSLCNYSTPYITYSILLLLYLNIFLFFLSSFLVLLLLFIFGSQVQTSYERANLSNAQPVNINDRREKKYE